MKILEYKSNINQKVADTFCNGATECSRYFLICFLLLGIGCGSEEDTGTAGFDASIATQSSPFINRVSPTSGKAGTTITIFGFGFSNEAANNIITLGGQTTTATQYTLLANPTSTEIESLTFTIPSGATSGANSVFVISFENTSNANIQFTINP